MERLVNWWRALMLGDSSSAKRFAESSNEMAALYARCTDLEDRLHWADEKLRERTELLYELQRQYSTEHFSLQASMRDLKTERLRNAGANASLDTILERAHRLQKRITELKARLRTHEIVDDMYFDEAPIFIEDGQT